MARLTVLFLCAKFNRSSSAGSLTILAKAAKERKVVMFAVVVGFFISVVAIVILIIYTGIYIEHSDEKKRAGNVKAIGTAKRVLPVEYGKGLYYFKANEAQFGKSLADFCEENKLEVVSISSDNTGLYGKTVGYFVVLQPNAQR